MGGVAMDLSSIAVVFEAPRDVKLREIQLPEPGDEDIIIDNVYTGISVGAEGCVLCGDRPEEICFPCVPGYQQSGIVTYTGSKVSEFKIGDRVNSLRTKLPPDVHYGWGGHSSRSVTNARSAVKIPDKVSLKEASLAKLFAVGYHGVKQANIQEGDLVALIGLGVIGQGFAQIARARGAQVIGADVLHTRLELARTYSCDVAVLSNELANAIREIKSEGADVVVDTTGKTETIDACVRLVREGGKVVGQGWYPGRVSFDFHPAHTKRVRMMFPCAWEGEEIVLDMLAKRELTIEPLITHLYSAKEAPKAYQMILNSPQEFLGITLKWRDDNTGSSGNV